MASSGVHRSGWKISPPSTRAFNHGQVSDALCTGSSRDSRRSLLAAPAYSPRAFPSGRCCALALAAKPRGVGCQKGEGRIQVFAVFGQIEVHAADQVPRGVPALQEVLYPAFRLRQFDAERGVQFLPEGAQDLRASDTPRQSWEAPRAPAGPTPRRAAPGPSSASELSAEGRHVACAEFSPVGEDRRKRGSGFSRSEL